MKITYTFDTMDENFDREELYDIQNAHNYKYALWDIHQYLRAQWKYQTVPDDINKIYEKVCEIFDDYCLDI